MIGAKQPLIYFDSSSSLYSVFVWISFAFFNHVKFSNSSAEGLLIASFIKQAKRNYLHYGEHSGRGGCLSSTIRNNAGNCIKL